MSKRSDCNDEQQLSTTKCSKTCAAQPCIAGPSFSSPPSSSSHTTTPPSLSSSSAYSQPSTAYSSSPRKMKFAMDEYPRWNRGGRVVDKGKRRASDDDEEEAERNVVDDGMIGGLGGRHMMNYTGARKKWSHDMVAKMRNEAAAQSNASLQSSSQSVYSMDPAAQPQLGRGGPRSRPRRDSMEPEARHPAQPFVAARPMSVLGRQKTQNMKEEKKEEEMANQKIWTFVKRAWTGLGRK